MGLHETVSELQYTSVHAQGRETTSRSQKPSISLKMFLLKQIQIIVLRAH